MAYRNYSTDNNQTPPTEITNLNGEGTQQPEETSVPNSFILKKETYIASSLKNNIKTGFSEFLRPPIDEDIEQFFQIYREIFYDIPRRGDQSHSTLIEESKNYVEDYVDPKDTTILILNNKIESLQERIEQEFTTQQHPFYADGSLLVIHETGYWIMMGGRKREIPDSIFRKWYAANPYYRNGDLQDNSYFFDEADNYAPVSGIPDGPSIRRIEDFNDYNFQAPTDILTFNKLRNNLDQINVDEAELEILRLIIDEKQVADTSNSARVELAPARNPGIETGNISSTSNGGSTPAGSGGYS